ncbi:MAG: M23 family metallopeptidase [Reyranella sp.]|uniref:M23 family metallopeptidase n=1 Tax=Reyranella sp. TaxID=1929291 RepID=UPI003D1106B8
MKEVPLVAALVLALLAGSSAPGGPERFSEWVSAEERMLGAREADLPVTREVAVDGTVLGLADLALLRAKVSPALAAELRGAFAAALDLARDVGPGDTFHIRYAETRTPRGAAIARRLLWAEFRTTGKGSVAVHRFRGRDQVERLWFANGTSTRAPALRMPLDAVVVSSRFGVRPDPFEQAAAASARTASTASLKRRGPTKAAASADAVPRITVDTPLSVLLGEEPSPAAAKTAPRGLCPSCLHMGIDLLAPAGTPIHAAADGVVAGAAPNGPYGNWVRLEHAGGLVTVYGHLRDFADGIRPGRKVVRGDIIGLVGSTGHSTGAHLHFELHKDGRAVDPLASPAFKPERLHGPELDRFRRQIAQSLAQRDVRSSPP